ncbi:hypothetical protein K8R47_02435, partial [archaeon]|nr:hypothetical protein [archaeon]
SSTKLKKIWALGSSKEIFNLNGEDPPLTYRESLEILAENQDISLPNNLLNKLFSGIDQEISEYYHGMQEN